MRGERLGHEADLHQRPHLALHVGVEDPVDDRPVVDRLARRVLGVGVRRAPLQRGRAVAGGQQVVGADVDRLRAERGQFATAASCRPSCRCSSARRGRRTPTPDAAVRRASAASTWMGRAARERPPRRPRPEWQSRISSWQSERQLQCDLHLPRSGRRPGDTAHGVGIEGCVRTGETRGRGTRQKLPGRALQK